ncbi:MAG: hypothetical protein KAR85_05970 [Methanosarcinales archaeon]|nr:hypothetical protein [Methanosarcinales archaeon]
MQAYDRWHPKFQTVESTGLGKTLIQMLVREGLPVKDLLSTGGDLGKVTRARPAGGVYFVANTHASLDESLEEFVTDINAWGVPGTGDELFESVPMLDVEKQRKLIFDKYESQCVYSVDVTLNELAGLLNSEKTPTKSMLTNYVNKVKELKKGTGKYEELLEGDMQLLRTKCRLLQ